MRIVFWLITLPFLLAVAGCNTVSGIGEDVEAAGDAIGDLADDAEDELED